VSVEISEIQTAFDDVFDQALLFHGFTDYLRDYDVYIYASADRRTGIAPQHLRYRFKHCVRATVTSGLSPQIWKRSLDDRLLDHEHADGLEGYVWAVRWQALYPGMSLMTTSAAAERWSADLGIPFREAAIATNGHNISLVFSDLTVHAVNPGDTPFAVSA
jgi:hypothetical protein